MAEEDRGADDHQRDRERAAEPVAEDRVRAVHADVLRPPALFDAARGVEVDLVGRHRGAEQADDEVQVERRVVLGDVRDEAASDLRPVRADLHRGDHEDEHAQPAVPERPLDPLERRHPDDHRQRDGGEQDQPAIGEAGEELERDRDTADLAGERHQVDDLGRDERTERCLEADPLAHRVEDGLARHGGDAPAHLRVDDDPDDADRDHPHQLVAERRARGRVEHQVADVDEPADRGQDPEREPEHLVHAQPPSCFSCRSTFAATVRSDGLSCSRCKTAASRPASLALARTFRSIDVDGRSPAQRVGEIRRLDPQLVGLFARVEARWSCPERCRGRAAHPRKRSNRRSPRHSSARGDRPSRRCNRRAGPPARQRRESGSAPAD